MKKFLNFSLTLLPAFCVAQTIDNVPVDLKANTCLFSTPARRVCNACQVAGHLR